eukprot:gb/GFBE01024866.1/.p1 GENE.gb/GFBE01024866.1/~~gb/GFBE01024866.1/.p1  ORF type:complete len:364 (+),score=75.60 gb/GFBE01024866.1/:1-1092(+)
MNYLRIALQCAQPVLLLGLVIACADGSSLPAEETDCSSVLLDDSASALLQLSRAPPNATNATGAGVISVPLDSQVLQKAHSGRTEDVSNTTKIVEGGPIVDELKSQADDEQAQEANESMSLGPEELVFEYPGQFHRFKWYVNKIRGNNTDRWKFLEKMAGVAGAIVATFAINFVDVIWIMPFITDNAHATWNTMFYLIVCQLIATVSILIVGIRGQMEQQSHDGHTERILDLVTAGLLTAYAVYLVYEAYCWPANHGKQTEEGNDDGSKVAHTSDEHNSRRFMVLVVLGSLDQVAVYVPVLTTEVLNALELEIGVLTSTLLSVAVCRLLGQSQSLAGVIQAIPLWLIVSVLAVASYVQVFTAV